MKYVDSQEYIWAYLKDKRDISLVKSILLDFLTSLKMNFESKKWDKHFELVFDNLMFVMVQKSRLKKTPFLIVNFRLKHNY